MPSDKAGRVVFIGNIPYGVTEELIIEKLGHIGQVLSFRLVYDKETGRPKGFGFAEFADADAAASAVRNLNDHELMGRKLRVDYSNDGAGPNDPNANLNNNNLNSNAGAGGGGGGGGLAANGYGMARDVSSTGAGPGGASALPSLPPGTDLPQGLSCPDAISRTLSTLPPPQLLDIISQMKGLVMSDPAKATELLRQAPQLSYAIFQSLLLLGLVDTSVLASVVEVAASAATGGAIPPPPPPASTQQPPSFAPQVQPAPHQQQQPPQSYLPYVPLPSAPPAAAAAVPISAPMPQNVPTPLPYQFPPQAQPQPQQQTLPFQAAPLPAQQPQPQPVQQLPPLQQQQQQQQPSKEDLIRQVMAMTPQQIEQLAPAYRAQIVALRAQLMGGAGI